MALVSTVERLLSSPTIFFFVSATVLFAAYVGVHTFLRRAPPNSPPTIDEDLPLTGAFGYWTRRWDFFRENRDKSPTGNFSFHAGFHHIIGVTGDKARQLFFESRDLGFTEGYAVLFGQSPKVADYAPPDGGPPPDEFSNYFNRRLTTLLKNEQFKKKLPILKSDVQEALDQIQNEPSGMTNPFESIYRIVFRLTIRIVGATEIADDPQLRERVLGLFEMIDSSATATAVMFPKFPSSAILKRTYAGAQLYRIMDGLVKKRKLSGEKLDDPLQFLLDQGDRMVKIIEFVVGALYAGLLNSGINASWILCYLATNPEWRHKVQEEIRTVAAKYATNPDAPLRHQLDDIPLEAWESEFPVIDICLKESIRLNLLGAAFRKNISGKAIPTGQGNEIIPPGAFVTYAVGDVHLNPDIYTNPYKWDPDRYSPERAEDQKRKYAWMGWGHARHPCLGMRFAKLENNLITAYFFSTFDFELLDSKGNKVSEPPLVNLNGHSAQKPKDPLFLRTILREK